MKTYFVNLFLRLIPKRIADFIFYHHPTYKKTINGFTSFSQEGEDMVLKRVFNNKTNGMYVDIGAHHPILFSNTNYFYLLGWRGINIDGLPDSKTCFDMNRPEDINIELLVSEQEGSIEFFLFEPPLMNTISKSQAEINKTFDWCTLKGSVMVASSPLSKVLDDNLKPGTKIDFMSIDVEGAEMTVLRSNDWHNYKPDVLLIEFINLSIEEIFNTDTHRFLIDLSYVFFAKTGNTIFYKQTGFFEFQ